MEKKMIYDFATSADRANTNAEKYTLREALFGTVDVIPVWVADMDIDTPEFVLDAVKDRLKHPIVGYEEVPKSAYEAQQKWMREAHGFEYELEDVFYSHSVVASMHVAIEAFTQKGDGVIVQTPVYPPFFYSVTSMERELIKNPLLCDADGVFHLDIQDLKSKINKRTKLLLLCSPHNPVGRVWRREELLEILEVCLEYKIVVFADEIHSDLVYAPNKHTPFATLSDDARAITLTAIGVGKTFNMAGFAMSTIVVSDDALKQRFQKAYERVHFAQGNVLSHVAFESAYREGEVWLEELKHHLYHNFQLLESLCLKYSEYIKITPIEGTYLAWLDCRGLGLRDKKLRDFFIYDVKLGLNAGISFGREGSGFMRLNFAVSSAKMSLIIERLDKALQQRRKNSGKN